MTLIIHNHPSLSPPPSTPTLHLGSLVYNPKTYTRDLLRIMNRVESPLYATIHVLIAAQYLTYEHAAVKRRQLWGTEMYTDDSDPVAIIIHSGQYTPLYPHACDLRLEPALKAFTTNTAKQCAATPVLPDDVHDVCVELRVTKTLKEYHSSVRNFIKSRGWGEVVVDDHYPPEKKRRVAHHGYSMCVLDVTKITRDRLLRHTKVPQLACPNTPCAYVSSHTDGGFVLASFPTVPSDSSHVDDSEEIVDIE